MHISVRAESKQGKCLNPRKADLHRWRETFADYPSLWRQKPVAEGRERHPRPERKTGANAMTSRRDAGVAWANLFAALRASDSSRDRGVAAVIETMG